MRPLTCLVKRKTTTYCDCFLGQLQYVATLSHACNAKKSNREGHEDHEDQRFRAFVSFATFVV